MTSLLLIHWNPDPELCKLFGLSIRYYSLLWIVGITLSYLMVRRQYRDHKLADSTFEPLFFYCFLGILIGARLGHCLFYDWAYYQHHLLEMVLPVKFLPDGGWRFTGYMGLASHGGTLGLMFSLWLYCRKMKMRYIDVLDMIAVATPICACCIRLANLMNSEIVGKVTDVPWAFVFEREDLLPRHPAQLYEAIAYFIFFLGMVYLYRRVMKSEPDMPRTDFSKAAGKGGSKVAGALVNGYLWVKPLYHRGFFFGLCLTEIFLFRFFVEFLKKEQVDFEKGMMLNMGQWLSIPFVLAGIYFMCFYGRKEKEA